MPLKLRGDIKRDGNPGNSLDPFPGDADFCVADFHFLRLPKPPAAAGPREIHSVVAFSIPGHWHRHWLGDVSFFPLRRFASVSAAAPISRADSASLHDF